MTLPILYSFRRCPYAMRARLAIYASGQSCELREVVLRDKPQAMLDISPKGTVPVLQLPGGAVIEESRDIMLWALNQNDPQGWLLEGRTETVALIDQNDGPFKAALDRYKYENRFENVNAIQEREKAEAILKELNHRIEGQGYLCANVPTLADFAIFPFVRQFAHVDLDWFNTTPYEALQEWLAHFKDDTLFKSIMKKYPQWHAGDERTVFGA